MLTVKKGTYLQQQTPPSLPFACPWLKIDLVMDQELLQYFHASRVHKRSNMDSHPDLIELV